MSQKKLYVGNLPFRSTEAELEDAFGQYGTVESVNLVMDRETGRPRGFAFVEMGSDAEAAAAIEAMDGANFDGRNIKVNIARPRESRGGGGRGYGGGGGGGGRGRW